MTWTIALLWALGAPPQARPQPDPWFGVDKWMHFAASAVIQSVGYGAARGTNGHAASLRIGLAGAGVAGLGRELYDLRRKGRFSRRDLVWDAIGTGVAVAVLHAVR